MLAARGIELPADDNVKRETTATAATTVRALACDGEPGAFGGREMRALTVPGGRTAGQRDLRAMGGEDGNGQGFVEMVRHIIEPGSRSGQVQHFRVRTVGAHREVQPVGEDGEHRR